MKISSAQIRWFQLLLLLLVAAGCADTGASSKGASRASSLAPTPPVSSNTRNNTPSLWDNDVSKILAEASAYEKSGDLATSVEYLKIALTVDPENKTAREELTRAVLRRNNLAEKKYTAGNALRDSNSREATRNSLAALSIRTDYPEAIAALKELQLSSAEASLKARFKREHQGKDRPVDDDIDVANYSLEIAVLSFEDGDYLTAIHEFEKIRARYPRDEDIKLYLDSSYYNVGISWFTRKEFIKALSWLVKVKKGFERVDDFVLQCRQNLKPFSPQIYNEAVKLYKENRYSEAADRFETVVQIEPSHKMAKEYLNKSKKKVKEASEKSM